MPLPVTSAIRSPAAARAARSGTRRRSRRRPRAPPRSGWRLVARDVGATSGDEAPLDAGGRAPARPRAVADRSIGRGSGAWRRRRDDSTTPRRRPRALATIAIEQRPADRPRPTTRPTTAIAGRDLARTRRRPVRRVPRPTPTRPRSGPRVLDRDATAARRRPPNGATIASQPGARSRRRSRLPARRSERGDPGRPIRMEMEQAVEPGPLQHALDGRLRPGQLDLRSAVVPPATSWPSAWSAPQPASGSSGASPCMIRTIELRATSPELARKVRSVRSSRRFARPAVVQAANVVDEALEVRGVELAVERHDRDRDAPGGPARPRCSAPSSPSLLRSAPTSGPWSVCCRHPVAVDS